MAVITKTICKCDFCKNQEEVVTEGTERSDKEEDMFDKLGNTGWLLDNGNNIHMCSDCRQKGKGC